MTKTKPLTTRVALIDDHQLVRAGITELLTADPRISVVAQASDEAQAKDIFARSDIDVVLLDLRLGKTAGVELLKSFPKGKAVCILTMHTEPTVLAECIRAGALGYVSKFAPPAQLAEAVLAVARGETYYSTDLRQNALSFWAGPNNKVLTPREDEVLQLCACGRSNGEVAKTLNISKRTAEAHRANIFKKLSFRTQTDLVLYALRHGLIEEHATLDPLRGRHEKLKEAASA